MLAPNFAEAASRFWVGGSGTWDAVTTTHWSATSGGSGGASVPGSSDIATFDSSSGGGTITPNYDMTVQSIVISSFTGTLDFSANNNSPTITSQMVCTGTGTKTLNMGSGTWTMSGQSTVWSFALTTNLTLNANTSTIKITDSTNNSTTFSGGTTGISYYKLWYARGSSTGINGIGGTNMSFNNFIDTGTAAHTLSFTTGATYSFSSWSVAGSPGNLITVKGSNTSTYNFVKLGGGKVSSDYLDISHSKATPIDTWYAGNNSINNQGIATAGSGWIFSSPPFPIIFSISNGLIFTLNNGGVMLLP